MQRHTYQYKKHRLSSYPQRTKQPIYLTLDTYHIINIFSHLFIFLSSLNLSRFLSLAQSLSLICFSFRSLAISCHHSHAKIPRSNQYLYLFSFIFVCLIFSLVFFCFIFSSVLQTAYKYICAHSKFNHMVVTKK